MWALVTPEPLCGLPALFLLSVIPAWQDKAELLRTAMKRLVRAAPAPLPRAVGAAVVAVRCPALALSSSPSTMDCGCAARPCFSVSNCDCAYTLGSCLHLSRCVLGPDARLHAHKVLNRASLKYIVLLVQPDGAPATRSLLRLFLSVFPHASLLLQDAHGMWSWCCVFPSECVHSGHGALQVAHDLV